MAFSHNLRFLFAVVLAISVANVTADIVDDICAKTPQPATCKQLLGSDPRSKTSDLVALQTVAIDVASRQAKSGQSLVSSLHGGATEPKLKEIYSSCLENYGNSVDCIGQIPGFLRSKDYGSLGTFASAAIDGPATCDDNFSSSSPEPPQLKDASLKLRTICSAVLAINKKLSCEQFILLCE
nr:pectinesterase inhibitor-like [Ipomoea trifida]